MRRTLTFLVVGLLVASASSVPTFVVQRHDRDELRRALYRICQRQNLTRSELYARARAVDFALRDLRRRLPIMDCTPNLSGRSAVPLTADEQTRFLVLYRAGRVDPTP